MTRVGLLSRMYSVVNNEIAFSSRLEWTQLAVIGPLIRVSHFVRQNKLNSIATVFTVLALIGRTIEVAFHVLIVLAIPFANI